MNGNQRRFAADWWLFVIILVLVVFGIVMVLRVGGMGRSCAVQAR